MAALLVGMSVMAVMMTVAMPVWRQTVQRDKEAELVFRGEQYARAIGLFQRKSGPGTLPPSIDVLVQQRYVRKKYKDPITNDDFAPLLLSAATPPGAGQPGAGQASRGNSAPAGFAGGTFAGAQPGRGITGGASGGITGVASKSKEQSIRVYKGRNHYNEWQFVFTPPAQAPGVAGPPGSGPAGPGGQRGRGQGPGNPQRGPFPPGGQGGRPGGPPNGPFNPNGPTPGPIFPPGQPPPRGR